jgi:hypothetical protein
MTTETRTCDCYVLERLSERGRTEQMCFVCTNASTYVWVCVRGYVWVCVRGHVCSNAHTYV